MKIKKIISIGIVLPALALSISSCKKNNTAAPDILINDINISNSAMLGKYLSNKQGLTLYMFANDADGVSSCTRKQVTFRGWPLHTYSPPVSNGYGNTNNIAEAAGSTGVMVL